jgi:hypothetical protein
MALSGIPCPPPAPLEVSIVIVDQDPFCIHNIDLPRILIQVEEENATRKNIGLLVVLRRSGCRRTRYPVSEIPQEFAVRRILLDAVPLAASRNPNITFPIDHDIVLGGGARTAHSGGGPIG